MQCIGEEVLICDRTRDKELKSCIPEIEGIDTDTVIEDYKGVGYTCRDFRELREAEEYTTLLVLHDIDELPSLPGPIIIITDEHKLNVETLEKLEWKSPLISHRSLDRSDYMGPSDRYLIVKGFTGKIKNQFNELLVSADISRMFRVPLSINDEVCAILAMYRDAYYFNGISSDYANALVGVMQELRPDIDDRRLIKAYNLAAGGKGWAV